MNLQSKKIKTHVLAEMAEKSSMFQRFGIKIVLLYESLSSSWT